MDNSTQLGSIANLNASETKMDRTKSTKTKRTESEITQLDINEALAIIEADNTTTETEPMDTKHVEPLFQFIGTDEKHRSFILAAKEFDAAGMEKAFPAIVKAYCSAAKKAAKKREEFANSAIPETHKILNRIGINVLPLGELLAYLTGVLDLGLESRDENLNQLRAVLTGGTTEAADFRVGNDVVARSYRYDVEGQRLATGALLPAVRREVSESAAPAARKPGRPAGSGAKKTAAKTGTRKASTSGAATGRWAGVMKKLLGWDALSKASYDEINGNLKAMNVKLADATKAQAKEAAKGLTS